MRRAASSVRFDETGRGWCPGDSCVPIVSAMLLAPGLTASVTLVVDDADTALALGSGDVPVLGTPRVIALAEEATVRGHR